MQTVMRVDRTVVGRTEKSTPMKHARDLYLSDQPSFGFKDENPALTHVELMGHEQPVPGPQELADVGGRIGVLTDVKKC